MIHYFISGSRNLFSHSLDPYATFKQSGWLEFEEQAGAKSICWEDSLELPHTLGARPSRQFGIHELGYPAAVPLIDLSI